MGIGAVGEDRVDAESDSGFQRDTHRLIDPTDLLDRQAKRSEPTAFARKTRAAVVLRRGQSHQAELAHLLHDVDREVVLAIPLRGVRRDLGGGELADDLTELLVF